MRAGLSLSGELFRTIWMVALNFCFRLRVVAAFKTSCRPLPTPFSSPGCNIQMPMRIVFGQPGKPELGLPGSELQPVRHCLRKSFAPLIKSLRRVIRGMVAPPECGWNFDNQSRGKSSARAGKPSPLSRTLKYCGRALSHCTMLRPEGSYKMRPARIVIRAVSFAFPSNLATPQSM